MHDEHSTDPFPPRTARARVAAQKAARRQRRSKAFARIRLALFTAAIVAGVVAAASIAGEPRTQKSSDSVPAYLQIKDAPEAAADKKTRAVKEQKVTSRDTDSKPVDADETPDASTENAGANSSADNSADNSAVTASQETSTRATASTAVGTAATPASGSTTLPQTGTVLQPQFALLGALLIIGGMLLQIATTPVSVSARRTRATG